MIKINMPALVLNQVTKVYPGPVVALHDITLSIDQGEFFGLLGPNGAGKTTAIGILVSLVQKTSGSVTVCGYDLDREPNKVKACIGLVPQEFNFNTFEKNIDVLINQAGYYGLPRAIARERADYYLHKLGLYNKRLATPRELSGGMKRRLMIVRALVHEPQLLILDEPTAGVDVELRRLIWAFLQELNEQGRTIILTTHYLEEAEKLCQRIGFINHGRIIQEGSTVGLLQDRREEIFLLDLLEPIEQVPAHPDFTLTLITPEQIQAQRLNHVSLNKLFAHLNQHGISVHGMRPLSNRLEELFIQLTHTEDQPQ